MSLEIQLELFAPHDDFSLLMNEIDSVKKECSNVRRGIFSRFDMVKKDLLNMISKQQQEIDLLMSIVRAKNEEVSLP